MRLIGFRGWDRCERAFTSPCAAREALEHGTHPTLILSSLLVVLFLLVGGHPRGDLDRGYALDPLDRCAD